MEHNKIFGERINLALALAEKRQKDLAAYLHVKDNVISYFVSGTRIPNVEQLAKIASFCGVSADYLLGISDVASPSIETKAICGRTGLSDSAVESLLFYRDTYEKKCAQVAPFFSPSVCSLPEDYMPAPDFAATVDEFRDYYTFLNSLVCDYTNATYLAKQTIAAVQYTRQLLSHGEQADKRDLSDIENGRQVALFRASQYLVDFVDSAARSASDEGKTTRGPGAKNG